MCILDRLAYRWDHGLCMWHDQARQPHWNCASLKQFKSCLKHWVCSTAVMRAQLDRGHNAEHYLLVKVEIVHTLLRSPFTDWAVPWWEEFPVHERLSLGDYPWTIHSLSISLIAILSNLRPMPVIDESFNRGLAFRGLAFIVCQFTKKTAKISRAPRHNYHITDLLVHAPLAVSLILNTRCSLILWPWRTLVECDSNNSEHRQRLTAWHGLSHLSKIVAHLI